ncbi:MAG TPA: DUF2142 domain-containing protein [Egibacteraceae bacterium]|nr:DUF2142 domain-containing protein [Egibacteraceae bacterium]
MAPSDTGFEPEDLTRATQSAKLPPVLAVGAFGLLLLGWVVGNPPLAGPDESGHYARALGITTDGLVGASVSGYAPPDLDPLQRAIVAQAVREVTLPPGLAPQDRSCFLHRPAESVACLDRAPPAPAEPVAWVTNVGTYQPAFYVLPGYLARLGPTPEVAAGIGRGVSAATALALLALGIAALWRPGAGGLPLVGPLVAVTPMVVFTAAALNPSGPEIAAGFALAAGLLRMARDPAPPAWVWGVTGVAGAALVLGRSIGPLWLAVHLLVFLVVKGPSATVGLVRTRPARAAAAAVVVGVALAGNLAFEAAYGLEVRVDPRPLGPSLVAAWEFTREAIIRHAVGVFGHLDVPLPSVLYWTWWSLTAGLWGLALVVGTMRQRTALALSSAGVLMAPVLLETLVLRHHGFHIQGRHVLPILVIVPLLAGEIVAERRARLPRRSAAVVPAVTSLTVAGVHVLAWYTNGRRAAVGIPGSWAFPLGPEWAPPGSWLPWLAVVVTGSALLAVAALTATATGRRDHAASSVP